MKQLITLLLVLLIGIFVGKSNANVVTSLDNGHVIERTIPGEELLQTIEKQLEIVASTNGSRIYRSEEYCVKVRRILSVIPHFEDDG